MVYEVPAGWHSLTFGLSANSDTRRCFAILGDRFVALKITSREVVGVAVVALEGRIVLGEESNALRERIKSLLAANQKKIVLNMDNVTYIDSAGLGTLVAAQTSAKSQKAGLKLSNLGSKFQEVLQVTKLLTVFDVYDTEAAAVRSFEEAFIESRII